MVPSRDHLPTSHPRRGVLEADPGRWGSVPPVPAVPEDTGLPFFFLCDLVLKTLFFHGSMLGREIAERACVPWHMVGEILKFLSGEGYCGTTGLRGPLKHHETFAQGLQYSITTAGRERARELFELSQYAGPAPVPLEDYLAVARDQAQEIPAVTHRLLQRVLQDLVLAPSVLHQLGPGLRARQAIFIYGPPGNGKSTLAEACASLLGGPIFIPHALYIHGEVIRLFDPLHHRPVEGPLPEHDRRWALCHRPVVRAGGELTKRELELGFDSGLRFYEAPLQLKANGGLFLIDDFGRQAVPARDILNRLVVPLEAGYDFLNIARASTTVAVPFTELLMLSTNIAPRELVDEAFLRRVRYKVQVPDPTEAEFREIFRRVCEVRRLAYDDGAVTRLLDDYYRRVGRPLHGCHPRDLVDHVINTAGYFEVEPSLSPELVDHAVIAYFGDVGQLR